MAEVEARVFAGIEGDYRLLHPLRRPPFPALPGVAVDECRGAFGGVSSLELVHVLLRAAEPRGGLPGRKSAFHGLLDDPLDISRTQTFHTRPSATILRRPGLGGNDLRHNASPHGGLMGGNDLRHNKVETIYVITTVGINRVDFLQAFPKISERFFGIVLFHQQSIQKLFFSVGTFKETPYRYVRVCQHNQNMVFVGDFPQCFYWDIGIDKYFLAFFSTLHQGFLTLGSCIPLCIHQSKHYTQRAFCEQNRSNLPNPSYRLGLEIRGHPNRQEAHPDSFLRRQSRHIFPQAP